MVLMYQCDLQTGYLGLIGGLNVKAMTTADMKALMVNDLTRKFNYCGHGHRGKHSFAVLQLKGFSSVVV